MTGPFFRGSMILNIADTALLLFLPLFFGRQGSSLELRQYKNDSIPSKIIPILKLPRFFPRRIADEKER